MQNRDEEFVSWTTDKGYLHLGRVDRRSHDSLIMKFRLLANGPFSNPPAYLPPDPKVLGDAGMLIAGSSDGTVYALSEHDGEIQWKFAVGDPVVDSPVIIEDRVYATSELGGLVCAQREDRQAGLVGAGDHALCRGRATADLCRR